MWMWSTGINRNIVECKDLYTSVKIYGFCVLIETLWNVKREHKKWILRDFAVLIETLWNVKLSGHG